MIFFYESTKNSSKEQRYSNTESESKFACKSGWFVIATVEALSRAAAVFSSDGGGLFLGDILCFPKQNKKENKARESIDLYCA